MDKFTGGCRCGNVRIVASGRPHRVGICHCLDCRKHHGALFYAAAIFPLEAVRIDAKQGTMPDGSIARIAAPPSLRAAVTKSKCTSAPLTHSIN